MKSNMPLTTIPPLLRVLDACGPLERGWKTEMTFLRWCRRRGTRVACTVHNLLPHESKPFHVEIYADFYRMADALICHDTGTAGAISERFGIESKRIHVIPHGPLFAKIPSRSPEQCRMALGIPPARQMYLALGVLARYKGLDLLLESWSDLVSEGKKTPRPLLVIAGTGAEAEKTRVREHAAKLEIDPDTLRLDLDYVPASRLPLYLQAADVLLYPYREITTSGALLTGLNYCKPIIASDLLPFRNYLHPNVNALVLPPGDRDALTRAMSEMRDQLAFDHLQAGSADNRILQTQWDEIAARTAEVYQAVLN